MKRKLYIIMFIFLISSITAQPFDTTNLSDAENVYEQAFFLNESLNGLVGDAMLIITFSITFLIVTARTGNAMSGVSTGGYFTTVSALLLLPMGFIGWGRFELVLAIFAASVAVNIMTPR